MYCLRGLVNAATTFVSMRCTDQYAKNDLYVVNKIDLGFARKGKVFSAMHMRSRNIAEHTLVF